MMEALGGWLKQIILVVLLATFIDLLLPNRTMQRYVRLVVSLFILMTILAPVLQLLGSNANLRMLAATVDGWSISGTQSPSALSAGAASSSRSMPALGEVLSAGEAMKRERETESLTLLAARLEPMIVDHVKTQHEVSQVTAVTKLALDADGMPVIEHIRIRIGLDAAAASTSSSGESAGAEGMRPIEPVTVAPVEIEPIAIGSIGRDTAAAVTEEVPVWRDGATPDGQAKRIAESVAKAWSIPPTKVKVEHVK
jgi:stage III sporulation protein AF